MEQNNSCGLGDSSRKTSCVKLGDRQIFKVDLRHGETTFVSWKKLTKDAKRRNNASESILEASPPNVRPSLEVRIAPGQPVEDEMNDAPPPNRFSAVIEKIERLYMGEDSSDEEDLRGVPDDNQYDTEDSFIDDAELDEYFEVDNSAIKHDGFFVNRGKLERMNEAPFASQQPKKRRRKALKKGFGDGANSNKHIKLDTLEEAKITQFVVSSCNNHEGTVVAAREHGEQDKFMMNPSIPSGVSSKKSPAESKMLADPSAAKPVSVHPSKVSNGNYCHESTNSLNQKHDDGNGRSQVQPANSTSKVVERELPTQSIEKNEIRKLPDLNLPNAKSPVQASKTSHGVKKDGSIVRPKASLLEKAIRELETMVAESRPPAEDNQESDALCQAIKRRLSSEVKIKLSKVARLAASQGKISTELVDRLMGILGHLMQLRTLKRHLRIMINTSLLAKQEKDGRFQRVRKEVTEMIKERAHFLQSKPTIGPQDEIANGFQEGASAEHRAPKRKIKLDLELEEKLCDLYDLFIDGLEEDAAPQVRKLYAELAGLWPKGFIDDQGVKHAIRRAKVRRREIYNKCKTPKIPLATSPPNSTRLIVPKAPKDQEKIKKKTVMAPTLEAGVQGQAIFSSKPHVSERAERLGTEFDGPVSSSNTKSMANKPSSNFEQHQPDPSRRSMGNSMDEQNTNQPTDSATNMKMKAKRKAESDACESTACSGPDKDSHKSTKQAPPLLQRLNIRLRSPPRFEPPG